ncbi:tetratricopeptide repeat protein [Actinoplanes sp. NPDC020271]|uniref:tetratricopeptide repeat protein n=1 Tax=Actinoplanes sp. NPDC020271 TaxID=3363896 RepID=UPI00378755F4
MSPHVNSAQRHLRRGEYAQAEVEAQAVLDGGDEAAGRILQGRADLERGRLVAALEQFEKAAAAAPDSAQPYAWQVAALDRQDRDDEAWTHAERALKRFPASVDLLIAAGRASAGRLDFRTALLRFRKAARLAPSDPRTREWEVTGLRLAYRYDDATAAIDGAIADQPGEPCLYRERGYNLCRTSRHDAALRAYETALSIDPLDRATIECMAAELCHLGRRQDAERRLRDAQTRLPEEAWPSLALADQLSGESRYLESLVWCEEALRREPQLAEAITLAADTERALGRPDDAHDRLTAALAGGSVQCRPRLQVADAAALLRLQRLNEALTLLERLLEQRPHSVDAITRKVECLNAMGRSGAATDALRKATIRFGETRLLLAWQLYDHGDPDGALSEYQKYIKLDSWSLAASCGKVRVLGEQHRMDDAVEAAETAIRRWPRDIDPLLELAYLRTDEKRLGAALQIIDQALQLQPTDESALRWRVLVLQELGRWGAAETAAAEWKARSPESALALEQYLDVLDHRGWPREADRLLNRELDRRPHDLNLLLLREQRLRSRCRYDDALAVLDELASRYDASDVCVRRTESLIGTRRFEQCEAEISGAIDRFGRRPELLTASTELQLAIGGTEAALELCDQILEADPDNLTAARNRIEALLDRDRLEDAERCARQERLRRPENADSHLQLARVHHALGDYDLAITECRTAAELEPGGYRAAIGELLLLRAKCQFATAEERARRARSRWPELALVQIELGLVLAAQNRFSEAVAEFDAVLRTHPTDSFAAIVKSGALCAMRRFAEAEALISRFCSDQPYDRYLRAELGRIQSDRQQPDAARITFRGLLRDAANPAERQEACCALGWIEVDQCRSGSAEEHFRAVLEESPRCTDALLGVASVLVGRGESAGYDEAEQLCRRLLELRPYSPEAHTCLGQLHAQRQEPAEAYYHLRRAVDINPFRGNYVKLADFLLGRERLDEAGAMLSAALRTDPDDVRAHVLLGRVFLGRADSAAQGDGKDAAQAAYHFGQAYGLRPESEEAALGMAVACACGAAGGLVEAERILRRRLAGQRTDVSSAAVRVVLARVLVQQGQQSDRSEFYADALDVIQPVLRAGSTDAECHYLAALADLALVGAATAARPQPIRWRRARARLRTCTRLGQDHVEARHLLRAMQESERAARPARRVAAGSGLLVAVSIAIVVLMWAGLAGAGPKIEATMVVALTPVMVGLAALSLVLPTISRMNLPGGVRAELSAGLDDTAGRLPAKIFAPIRHSWKSPFPTLSAPRPALVPASADTDLGPKSDLLLQRRQPAGGKVGGSG